MSTSWLLGRDVMDVDCDHGQALVGNPIVVAEEDAPSGRKDEPVEALRETIHENHVFQLYGTVVLAQLENCDKQAKGTFTTTTKLSEKAREVADFLGIRVEEDVPLADNPRIKCNVARDSEERIYHLPMDKRYDKTTIEADRGERYVSTVAEAEDLGFRRAWRWRGP
jgi:hypothetical protein